MLEVVTILDLQLIEKAKDESLIAIVSEVTDSQTYYCRDGLSRTVQQVVLVDDTKTSVALTLWTDYLLKLDAAGGSALKIEDVPTKEYRGLRTLSTTSTTILRLMDADPTPQQAYLKRWWNSEEKEDDFDDISVPQ